MLAAQQGSLRARSAYLGRRSIFLLRATQHDLQRIIRQWPPQRLRLIPWRAHPHIALLVRGQDHRHGLGMYRLDYGVGRCSEKAVDLMRSRDRLRLSPPVIVEGRPDASKGEQRPIFIEREPDHVLLLGLRVRLRRVLGKAVGWD